MSISGILLRFIDSVRQNGLHTASSTLWRRAMSRWKERSLGISTTQLIFPAELGFTNPDCHEHQPTEYDHFQQMLRAADIDPRQHSFLDYGAGLGRVVVLAATLPFAKVRGVELSEDLTRLGRKNIANAASKLACKDVDIICADATQFVPEADTSLIYFNHPFGGEVLSAVLVELQKLSLARQLRIIANIPAKGDFMDQLNAQSWLRRIRELVVEPGRVCLILDSVRA
jgi:predicted RNA methylase